MPELCSKPLDVVEVARESVSNPARALALQHVEKEAEDEVALQTPGAGRFVCRLPWCVFADEAGPAIPLLPASVEEGR